MGRDKDTDTPSNVVDLDKFKKDKERKKEAELRDRIIARAIEDAKRRGW